MIRPSRRGSGNVTVDDVAAAAGVSAMTVSRVINRAANVRDTTRAAVLEAIERLKYAPNAAARTLAAGDATTIGLLYANPSAVYLSQFLIGALAAARRAGAHLLLELCEGESEAEQADATRRFAETDVSGVVLPPPLSESKPVLAELAAAGIPAVRVAGSEGLVVRIDDFDAARAMTRHLIDLGHRRIGFIRGHPNQHASAERWRGFSAALNEAGLDPATMPVEQGYFTFRSGTEAAERMLGGGTDATAIFASNDDMAAAAVGVAHRIGLHVPEDLSIVGFDDTSLATSMWPELTTVRQPIAAMADAAVGLLIAKLRRAAGDDLAVLSHEVVIRGSSAPPPVAQRQPASTK